jgi:hypothetical protein
MSTTDWRGGTMTLSAIRSDLENPDLTPTQRKAAFEHLRRWLRERPDDADALELWRRYEGEFGREGAETPITAETSGEGFEALTEAERRAGGSATTEGGT